MHITVKLALDHTVLIAALIPFSLGVKGTAGPHRPRLPGRPAHDLRGHHRRPAQPVRVPGAGRGPLARDAHAGLPGLVRGAGPRPVRGPRGEADLHDLCTSCAWSGSCRALALRSAPRPFKRKFAAKVAMLLGNEERPGLDDLDASRAAWPSPRCRATRAGAAAEGRAGRGQPPFTETGSIPRVDPAATQYETQVHDPGARHEHFAAAYRTVAGVHAVRCRVTDQTSRMNVPMDMQNTQAIPRADSGGSTSGSWPIPSPPPVGEAPPSAYDPLQDTGYNIPTYNNAGAPGYGEGYVYDTGESNAAYGTYNPNDTYNSGPATDQTPGASYDFDAPGGSGEPWNTPSGGYR
jgi:hypothetical protein